MYDFGHWSVNLKINVYINNNIIMNISDINLNKLKMSMFKRLMNVYNYNTNYLNYFNELKYIILFCLIMYYNKNI